MYCPKCGKQVPNDANFCTNCGTRLQAIENTTAEKDVVSNDEKRPTTSTPTTKKTLGSRYGSAKVGSARYGSSRYGRYGSSVESHIVGAILVTIFCCLPFGIVAIVFAAQTSSYAAEGDILAARRASDNAQTWITLGIIFGIVGGVLTFMAEVGPLFIFLELLGSL